MIFAFIVVAILGAAMGIGWLREKIRHAETRANLLDADSRLANYLELTNQQSRHLTTASNRLRIAEASADVLALHTAVLCDELKTKTVFNRIPLRFIKLLGDVQGALDRHREAMKERNEQGEQRIREAMKSSVRIIAK